MKLRTFLLSAMCSGWLASLAFGQHAGDIEFGYDDLITPQSLVIEQVEVTNDGRLFFESEFEQLDPFNPDDFGADEPGFNTNDEEDLLVNPGDQIWISAVNASLHSAYGMGYVNYYNPAEDRLESFGRIAVMDNTDGTSDLFLNGSGIESGVNPQLIGSANGLGGVHDHVIFDLLDDSTTPLGAYGIMFQLQGDFASADGNMDVSSDPFWIVFNHGMSESDFETFAVPKYGVFAVPEPGSTTLCLLGGLGLVFRRRKRAIV